MADAQRAPGRGDARCRRRSARRRSVSTTPSASPGRDRRRSRPSPSAASSSPSTTMRIAGASEAWSSDAVRRPAARRARSPPAPAARRPSCARTAGMRRSASTTSIGRSAAPSRRGVAGSSVDGRVARAAPAAHDEAAGAERRVIEHPAEQALHQVGVVGEQAARFLERQLQRHRRLGGAHRLGMRALLEHFLEAERRRLLHVARARRRAPSPAPGRRAGDGRATAARRLRRACGRDRSAPAGRCAPCGTARRSRPRRRCGIARSRLAISTLGSGSSHSARRFDACRRRPASVHDAASKTCQSRTSRCASTCSMSSTSARSSMAADQVDRRRRHHFVVVVDQMQQRLLDVARRASAGARCPCGRAPRAACPRASASAGGGAAPDSTLSRYSEADALARASPCSSAQRAAMMSRHG